MPLPAAFAQGKNVAVIDSGSFLPLTEGQSWCVFLTDHGYACTLFPKQGPTGPLDPFDVVVDMSYEWSDPTGMLADFMRAGKTVITVHSAPWALGINSNPTVQAWIGANASSPSADRLETTVRDPILGDIAPGTEIHDCADGPCWAVGNTSGHPDAKVLARFVAFPGEPIGILRNIWEGGISVYFGPIYPYGYPLHAQIVLNAVRARQLIPTLGTWGLLVLALGISIAGTIVLRRRQALIRSRTTLPTLLVGLLAMTASTLRADVTATQEGSVTQFRLGSDEPFYSTDKTVSNLRSLAIPDSPGMVVLWEETDPNSARRPFYAVSLDGTNVDEVRATTYQVQTGYAGFDPAITTPIVPASLSAGTDSELYIVQFVTQPLSAFRAALKAQGATIYDFLPNHAYVVRLPASARPAVAALPFVRAVVPFHPAYRLEAFLRDNLDRAQELFPLQRYNIRVLDPAQKKDVAARIAAIGGAVDSADAGKRLIVATVRPAELFQIAGFNEVLFIARWAPMEPDMNNV